MREIEVEEEEFPLTGGSVQSVMLRSLPYARSFVLIITRDNGSEPRKVCKNQQETVGYLRGGRVVQSSAPCRDFCAVPWCAVTRKPNLDLNRLEQEGNKRGSGPQGVTVEGRNPVSQDLSVR
jgi:hypothetical protein